MYILQENRAKFNQYTIDDTCTLCRANFETRVHFLVECSRLSSLRQGFIQAMRNILITSNTKSRIDEVLTKIVSEYDQEIPQSQTADNPVAPRGRAAQPSRDTRPRGYKT